MTLPQEPRAPSSVQQTLTHVHLDPKADRIGALWRAARAAVDPRLAARRPIKGGKAYPLGQCLEISQAVLVAVQDFAHFARIARAYWGGAVYPNHLFPTLAPWFPLISEVPGTGVRLQVGNDYMIALAQRDAFEPALRALAEGELPPSLGRRVAKVFAAGELGFAPADGREHALAACARERTMDPPDAQTRRDHAVARLLEVNRRLAKVPMARSLTPESAGPLQPPAPAERQPPSPSELIRTATQRLMRDPSQAAGAFAAALNPTRSGESLPTPVERVRLGLCLGLAWFRLNRVAASLAVSESALRLAATLPWPAAAPAPAIPFDADAAGRQLEDVLAALCQAGFHAFATGGALLGLIREGRLMDHDRDLDVVVPIEEFPRVCDYLTTLDWQPAWIPVDAANFRAFVHLRSKLTSAPIIGGAIGAFDLPHIGHLRFLRAARQGCDWLKVAACTERTAKHSKGRIPVIPLEQRLELLGALRCVDEVGVFDGALAETRAAAGWIQAWGVQRLFVSQVWAASERWRALEPEFRMGL